MNETKRYYALDNLRAVLMWLGVVIHVAVNHVQGDSILPWRDSATTPLADLIVLPHTLLLLLLFHCENDYYLFLLISLLRGYMR